MRMVKVWAKVKMVSPLLAAVLVFSLGLLFASPINMPVEYAWGTLWGVIAVLFAWVIWLITRSTESS